MVSEHRYERFGETLSRETVELVKSRLSLIPPFINPEKHHEVCEIPDKMFRWCNCNELPLTPAYPAYDTPLPIIIDDLTPAIRIHRVSSDCFSPPRAIEEHVTMLDEILGRAMSKEEIVVIMRDAEAARRAALRPPYGSPAYDRYRTQAIAPSPKHRGVAATLRRLFPGNLTGTRRIRRLVRTILWALRRNITHNG